MSALKIGGILSIGAGTIAYGANLMSMMTTGAFDYGLFFVGTGFAFLAFL